MADRSISHSPVLIGLAENPAAPPDVLLRLLGPETADVAARVAWRGDLPDVVADAVVSHPDEKVRAAFAESPYAAAAQRARLVDDPAKKVRLALTCCPTRYRALPDPLPDHAYERLFNDPHPTVRREALAAPCVPLRLLAGLAHHPDPDFRHAACRAWHELTHDDREALLADDDPHVRRAAALRAASDDERYTAQLAQELEAWKRNQVLSCGRLDRALAEHFAHSDMPAERAAIAENPSLPADLVAHLAQDPDPSVRLAVSVRPGLSEEQRAAIAYEIKPTDRLYPLPWVWEAREDLDVLRRCAHSAHLWLRRSAAASPHLPPDLVELLAQDDDFVVRLFLCENHPTPPPELVWQIFLRWDGYTLDSLVAKPGFPRHRLAALADHEDPRLRRYAVRDPGASPQLLEELSRDEVDSVRCAAPVSYTRAPRLPLGRLHELLSDPVTARFAAENPALPAADMHRLLDEAGSPPSPASSTPLDPPVT